MTNSADPDQKQDLSGFSRTRVRVAFLEHFTMRPAKTLIIYSLKKERKEITKKLRMLSANFFGFIRVILSIYRKIQQTTNVFS